MPLPLISKRRLGLHTQAKDNKADQIAVVVKVRGIDVNYGNSIDQTALHLAALWCSLDVSLPIPYAGSLLCGSTRATRGTHARQSVSLGTDSAGRCGAPRAADPVSARLWRAQ